MKIEMGGEYQTRDGCEVRLYAVDGGGTYPIHGAWLQSDGTWWSASWTSKGSMYNANSRHAADLVPKPKTVRMPITVRMGYAYLPDRVLHGHIDDDGAAPPIDHITLIKHPDGRYEVEK